MKKIIIILLSLMAPAAWADCVRVNGGSTPTLFSESLDLSSLFTTTDTATESRSTFANISLNCSTLVVGSSSVNYISPMANGYWVEYISPAGISRWVKFVVSDFISRQEYGPGNQTSTAVSYTLTATLLPRAPGAVNANFSQSTTTGVATLTPLVLENTNWGIFVQIPTVDQVAAIVASKAWTSKYLAYNELTVTFNPPETTCDMPDQNVHLPKVSLSDLKLGMDTGSTPVQLPVTCSNTLVNASTRGISAWLYSADIVDSNNLVMRNGSSTSSGIGIALKNSAGSDISLSAATTQNTATSILNIVRGGDSSNVVIDINAFYKIFDTQTASAGTVIATAMLYFNYE